MEYKQLGRTGVRVSALALGTVNLGPITPEPESHQMLSRALDAGINFIDTANVYGLPQKGLTEEVLGRWFAADTARRDRVVLASKVFHRMGDGPNDGGLSALHIRRACEDSLRRLQTDRIDLYQLHHVERSTSWEEIWQALDVLIRDGKILYAGTSNFAAWQIVSGNAVALARGSFGLVSEQSLYNLTQRTIELEVVPALADQGMALLPYSPLAGGLLGGMSGEGGVRRSWDLTKDALDRQRARIEGFEKLCADLGEEPAVVALAWLLTRPGVTAPIIGPRTLEQFEASLRALDLKLDDATLTRLDELFPGPGGPAPEAYAW